MAWNWANALGQGAQGGLGGAASGAAIGSFVPGIGTAVGAGVGGLLGLLGGGLSGGVTSDQAASGFEQTPAKFTPEQQKALSMLLQQGTQNLQNPTAGFDPIEKYHRGKFQSDVIPSLAERFTSLGGSDTRQHGGQSPYLANMASDFENQMAALRAQYGQQNQQNALSQLSLGLTPQFEQVYFGKPSQLGSGLFESGMQSLGPLAQNLMSQQQQQGQVKKSGVQFTPQQTSYLVNLLKAQQGTQANA